MLFVVVNAALLNVLLAGRRATAALAELRGTAPTFHAQAQALLDDGKIDEALQKIGYAVKLAPDNASHHLLRAHALQTQLRFPEAIESFTATLRIATASEAVADARANLALCEKLRAENSGAEFKKESLRELYDALVAQHRTGEALTFAKHGIDPQELLRGYRDRIAAAYGEAFRSDVYLLADNTIRFIVPNKGIADLRPLHGMPISDLNLHKNHITDISALVGMPLKQLDISENDIPDLSPLRGMPLVRLLIQSGKLGDLGFLVGMPLEDLDLNGCRKVHDLTPLKGMPIGN